MLHIITKRTKSVLHDVEIYFNSFYDFTEFNKPIYKKIVRKIDNAILDDNGIIQSPIGKCTLKDISTGCKSILLLVYLKDSDIIVPLNECGLNAIDVAFELGASMDLYGYLSYGIVVNDKNAECFINGKYYKGPSDIYKAFEVM